MHESTSCLSNIEVFDSIILLRGHLLCLPMLSVIKRFHILLYGIFISFLLFSRMLDLNHRIFMDCCLFYFFIILCFLLLLWIESGCSVIIVMRSVYLVGPLELLLCKAPSIISFSRASLLLHGQRILLFLT